MTVPLTRRADVLEPYARVLPLTVLNHSERRGYAASVEALLRRAVELTDRPKRDAAILMHADFAHNPATLPDLVRRVDSGADVVVAEGRVEGEIVQGSPLAPALRADGAARCRLGAGCEGRRVGIRHLSPRRSPERAPQPTTRAAGRGGLGRKRRAVLANESLRAEGRGPSLLRASRPPRQTDASPGVGFPHQSLGVTGEITGDADPASDG